MVVFSGHKLVVSDSTKGLLFWVDKKIFDVSDNSFLKLTFVFEAGLFLLVCLFIPF